MPYQPQRIVSGGQTGADGAGLDWAIARGIPHGGFCPRGRLAEDGVIGPQYRLIQTRTADYRERTEANVKAGDATIIFTGGKLTGGSKLTQSWCVQLGKPHLVVTPTTTVDQVSGFLLQHTPAILNIAGNRASRAPGIGDRVLAVLTATIRP